MKFRTAVLWIAVLAGCGPTDTAKPPRSSTAETSPAIAFHTPYGPPKYPFSPAVQVGNLLFLAGQIGTDSTGKLVAGGIKAEARQTMENIGDVLQRVGSSWDKVVKCTVMMADMAEWPAHERDIRRLLPPTVPGSERVRHQRTRARCPGRDRVCGD